MMDCLDSRTARGRRTIWNAWAEFCCGPTAAGVYASHTWPWNCRPGTRNPHKLDVFPPELLRYELLAAVYRQQWAEVDALCRRLQYWNPSGRFAGGNLPAYLAAMGYMLDSAPGRGNLVFAEPLQFGQAAGPQRGPSLAGTIEQGRVHGGGRVSGGAGQPLLSRSLPDHRRYDQFAGDGPGAQPGRPRASDLVAGDDGSRDPRPAAAAGDDGGTRRLVGPVAGQAGHCGRAGRSRGSGVHPVPWHPRAAEAHLWLADREMSAGRIAAATTALESALAGAAAEQRPAIEARLRLAGGLMGVDLGRPVQEPVELGLQQMPAEAFDAGWRRFAGGTLRAQAAAGSGDLPVAFPPGPYACRSWARFTLDDPSRWDKPAWTQQSEFDWVGYQTRTLRSARALIVAYPTRLTAFDLQHGRPLWSYQGAGDWSRLIWPPVPMQPIFAGGRIIVRRATEKGLTLLALRELDGQVLWTSDLKGEEALSDPLWIAPELFAITVARTGRDELALLWTRFDPASGAATPQRTLVELHNVWPATIPTEAIPCQATLLGDRIVVNVGGCVLLSDAAGRVRWLRRQTYLPWPKDSRYSASVRRCRRWTLR